MKHLIEGNEQESATRKYGEHLVARRNETGNVVKGKLVMLFRRFVLFGRNSGGKFGKVVKEKLVMLFSNGIAVVFMMRLHRA
jgi:hypothetical protein